MRDTHSTPADGLIGAVLGNYRIMNALSVGGMGSVYRARHELLDRPAAIKLLRPELTEDAQLVQRFVNEAKAATAIRHPGIVEVYDFGYTDDGHAYYVMELIDGELLSSVIAARGQLPELEAAQIARNLASALEAAHAKGIVHRDLKPDNIFLVPAGDGRERRVEVLDFGIAKLASSNQRHHTATGVLLGTPRYMAPEQAREAGTVDQRADLYSLGCILYELLAGAPPFVAEGAGEIIAMQLFAAPEPIGQRAQVSPEMAQLVMGLLAKEPAERPQSAHAVMEALVAIDARMSGGSVTRPQTATATGAVIDSAPTLRQPAPTIAPATLRQTASTPPPRSKVPFVLGGLALAVAGGAVAFAMSRASATTAPSSQPAPASQVVPVATTHAPSATKVETKVETKAEVVIAPPVVAAVPVKAEIETPAAQRRKKSDVQGRARNDKPAHVKTEIKPEVNAATKPAVKVEVKPEGPQTDKHSPIFLDLGDEPKKAP